MLRCGWNSISLLCAYLWKKRFNIGFPKIYIYIYIDTCFPYLEITYFPRGFSWFWNYHFYYTSLCMQKSGGLFR